MREDPVMEGGPWSRAHRLEGLTGLDPIAIWERDVVERVSTGLLCTQIELQPLGRDMLAAAEVVADL
jgi:streptomycin 6-kinase